MKNEINQMSYVFHQMIISQLRSHIMRIFLNHIVRKRLTLNSVQRIQKYSLCSILK